MIRLKCAAVLCALMASTLTQSIAEAGPYVPRYFSEAGVPLFTIEDGKLLSFAYRMGFVTRARTNALSPDIDYYNDIVIQAALSVPSLATLNLRWRAAVSTPTVDAFDNLGLGIGKLYGVNGHPAETGGSWLSTSEPMSVALPDETGATIIAAPGESYQDAYGIWTGTKITGEGDGLGSSLPRAYTLGSSFGWSTVGDLYSLSDNHVSNGQLPQTNEYRLYGISQAVRYNFTDNVFVALIPEPPGIAMWVFVLSGMFLLVARSRAGRGPAGKVFIRA